MERATKSDAQKATSAAHGVIDRAADSAQPAIDTVSAAAHDAVDRIAKAATPAAQWVSERSDQLRQAPTRVLNGASEYVRVKPLTALAIAAVAGALFARIFL